MLELKDFIALHKERYEKDVPADLKEKIADDIKYHAELVNSIGSDPKTTIYDDKNVYCALNNNLHSKNKGAMGFINGQRELKQSKI